MMNSLAIQKIQNDRCWSLAALPLQFRVQENAARCHGSKGNHQHHGIDAEFLQRSDSQT
jgi:hypothetical protein